MIKPNLQDFEEAETKIENILEWASDTDADFDTDFVESVYDRIQKVGYVTEAQMNALDNIIERWRIGE